MIRRTAKAATRLLLNWGVLIGVVAGALLIRQHAEVAAGTPLPPAGASLSGADSEQWRAFPGYHRTVPVLVYHGIKAGTERYSVTPQMFAQQMLALKTAGFHAITLAQYVHFVYGDWRGLPSKPILLTFDDGRRDAYRAANNILREYGFHGTMFTFGSWPVRHPRFSLTWRELQRMRRSGIWDVQVHGGRGHEYVMYDPAGSEGAVYAFRRYIPAPSGHGGYVEGFSSFVARATSDILWGRHEFASHLAGYRPLAFAVPYGDYGQQHTNDSRIPRFMLPWLKKHFAVVFGGDYLDESHGRPYEISGRFSRQFSYRISMGPRISLPILYCRLKDWAAGAPLWMEYRCLRTHPDVGARFIGPEGKHQGILTP